MNKNKKNWAVFLIIGIIVLIILICSGLGIIGGIIAIFSGKTKQEENISEDIDTEYSEEIAAAPDIDISPITDLSVSEEYAKTHKGYYIKTDDGTLYPLGMRVDQSLFNGGESFGVPNGDSMDLYWNAPWSLYWLNFENNKIISCGDVPIPEVESGKFTIISYTDSDYIYDINIINEVSRSCCTMFGFFDDNSGNSVALPTYGIYGEGRTYIQNENQFPYKEQPYTLEDLDGNVVGSFELGKYASAGSWDFRNEHLIYSITENPFGDLEYGKTYKWCWYEGSQYKEKELVADCYLYWPAASEIPVAGKTTKEGYYEYDVTPYVKEGINMLSNGGLFIVKGDSNNEISETSEDNTVSNSSSNYEDDSYFEEYDVDKIKELLYKGEFELISGLSIVNSEVEEFSTSTQTTYTVVADNDNHLPMLTIGDQSFEWDKIAISTDDSGKVESIAFLDVDFSNIYYQLKEVYGEPEADYGWEDNIHCYAWYLDDIYFQLLNGTQYGDYDKIYFYIE